MTGSLDRLRRADPASGLGSQPDERAEADLRLLLAEPQPVVAPARRPERRRLAPILVTAVVAIAVIALTASVLAFVHPRTDAGGTVTPTLGTGGCHPAEVLPFQCGTYRSTYGGKAVTGDLGGPAKDRLSISFTAQQGALLLTARTEHCFAEQVLVRYDGERLVRIGTPTHDQDGCFGKGADTRSWAAAFLRGPLEMSSPEVFGRGDTAVFFQYQGAAPIGQPQLPRNDARCVAAHVAPFSCDTFFSEGGTGTLAFLGTDLFRLSFQHLDGQLTASFFGRCNGLSVALQPDGNTVLPSGSMSSAMLCEGDPGAQDHAVSRFFSGTITYRIDGDRLTFASGGSTAVFSSRIGACLPTKAVSPFCGTSTAASGSGTVAFLRAGGYRLRFAGSGQRFTTTVEGACGATTYATTLTGSSLRLLRVSATTHSCPSGADAHDVAVDRFLTAGLVWRLSGHGLELDSAASGPFSSATFTR